MVSTKYFKLILRIGFVFFGLLLAVSCQTNRNPCSLPDTVLKDLFETDSMIRLEKIQERDKISNEQNYKEPSLFQADCETYRFIWDSSFDGAKVYRIEKRDNKYQVTLKVFGYHDTVPVVKEFPVSKKTWSNIVDSLNICGFWTFPRSDERQVLDGTGWMLEGYKPAEDKCTLMHYHCVGRESPIDEKFILMCDLLYNLKPE